MLCCAVLNRKGKRSYRHAHPDNWSLEVDELFLAGSRVPGIQWLALIWGGEKKNGLAGTAQVRSTGTGAQAPKIGSFAKQPSCSSSSPGGFRSFPALNTGGQKKGKGKKKKKKICEPDVPTVPPCGLGRRIAKVIITWYLPKYVFWPIQPNTKQIS